MLFSKLQLMPVALVCAALAGALFMMSPEPRLRAGDAPRPAQTAPKKAPAPAPAVEKPPEWKEVFTLEHTHRVTAVAASADLIVAAADVGPGLSRCVRFWNATYGKVPDLEITWVGYNAPVRFNFLRFTTNETDLILGSEHAAHRYRRRPGGLAVDSLMSFDLLACSADLNTLLLRKDPKIFKEAQPNRLFLHVNPWAIKDNFNKHSAVIELPDGVAVMHAAVSANDRRFAVAGDDAVIRVYDREPLKILHEISLPKKTVVLDVQLSDDGGRLVVVGEAGFARVFDTAAGKELCELKGHEGTVQAVAFSPDGKWVATASGKVARMFDAKSGKAGSQLVGHTDDVTAIVFRADGKRVVTGSADKTAKVWDRKE